MSALRGKGGSPGFATFLKEPSRNAVRKVNLHRVVYSAHGSHASALAGHFARHRAAAMNGAGGVPGLWGPAGKTGGSAGASKETGGV